MVISFPAGHFIYKFLSCDPPGQMVSQLPYLFSFMKLFQ